jgi:molybdopterin synthase catalytic subunit
MPVTPRIAIQSQDFDTGGEIEATHRAAGPGAGAVVSFSGLCRDEDGRLEALELEHYPGMAEAQIGRIAAEAVERWPVSALTVIHRHGRIRPGENIVLVVAASAHRQAAFDAASFLMDYLKSDAPFWKKEHLAGGGDGGWVGAKEADEAAKRRWEKS